MTENENVNNEAQIFEMAKNFASTQDVDALLSQISRAVEKLTSSEAASILLLDETKEKLVFRVATGDKGAMVKKFFVPVGKGVAGWVAQNEQPLIINDVEKDTRFTGQIDKSSGFSTKSILAIPMKAGGQLIGVCEALNKVGDGGYSPEDQGVLENLSSLAAATIANARFAEDHRNFFTQMLEVVTMAVEGGDNRLTGHCQRVAELACRIGRQLGLEGDDYRHLYYAGVLHDWGMIAVSDLRYLPKVVSRTMERTPEKLHPLLGAELVKNIRLLTSVAPLILHHHEYFDGSGHPDGLVGADIPLGARIIGFAEQIDEIYMKGIVGDVFIEEAIKQAQEGSGSKFDPEVVKTFLSIYQA